MAPKSQFLKYGAPMVLFCVAGYVGLSKVRELVPEDGLPPLGSACGG